MTGVTFAVEIVQSGVAVVVTDVVAATVFVAAVAAEVIAVVEVVESKQKMKAD